ncbi:alpha/beta fold hydrolase [Undibacterium terreum]|uniref:Hydrolase n=1 Tax=Undibacterium terreum TaxID=1224302 RepID=A0A916UJQ1_9BURK|nr:alpha/beta hydrolase [Undibacterium terreum]GGC76066.1 hydrolase [Undibacterium terreum]
MGKSILKGILYLLLLLLVLIAASIALTWAPDKPVSELKQRWAPPPSQFIAVKGLQVHIRDEGLRDDAVPILLIHGTSASLHTWEGWVAALKDKHRVITMDLPGFGLTGPNAQDDYSNAVYVRFMLDLMDKLGVQKCILGGNSLGGEIAWQVAAAAPQRVEKLILVDAGGYAFKPKSLPIGFIIARTPGLNKLMESTLPRSMIEKSVRNVYGDPAKVTPQLVDLYEAMTLREGNRHALGRRFGQLDGGASAEKIKALKQPTLIIWGAHDGLIPIEYGQQFHQDIAGSQFVRFDQLGHVPHEEDPVATVAVVKTFLN